MEKCKNKNRHKWVDKGKETEGFSTYDYYCKKCGKNRLKSDFVSYSYYDENMNPLGNRAPECVPNKN